MPTRMHLEILSGTYKFHRFYKLWLAVQDFTMYVWRNRFGGERVVVIYRTSKKCYRVMFADKWNVTVSSDERMYTSEYRSFRTQYELCNYLDTLV